MENKRSKGITVLAYLYRISGILGLIFSVLIIIMMFTSRGLEAASRTIPIPMNPVVFILLTIAISVFCLIIGNGLLKLKEQARKWAIYLSILGIIYGLVECFSKGFRIGSFIMPAIIIYFFTRPKVKEQFK